MPDEQSPETVALEGDLVIDTVRQASEQLTTRTTGQRVVADLAGVDFVDSTGLRMLLDAKAHLEEEGRTLTLTNPNSSVRLLLRTTGTAELFGLSLD